MEGTKAAFFFSAFASQNYIKKSIVERFPPFCVRRVPYQLVTAGWSMRRFSACIARGACSLQILTAPIFALIHFSDDCLDMRAWFIFS